MAFSTGAAARGKTEKQGAWYLSPAQHYFACQRPRIAFCRPGSVFIAKPDGKPYSIYDRLLLTQALRLIYCKRRTQPRHHFPEGQK